MRQLLAHFAASTNSKTVNVRLCCSIISLLIPFVGTACAQASLLDSQETSLDQEESSGDVELNPDAPKGSCTAWKFAYCDAIEACDAFSDREQCELDLGWLVCRDDVPLGGCEQGIRDSLDADDCDALPAKCGPSTIADRSLPTELCEEIHDAMCEFRFFCGLEFSKDACLETLSRTEPCSAFTSILPTAAYCAEAFKTLSCGSGLPEVCAGALRY
jgi:hypothetical protein